MLSLDYDLTNNNHEPAVLSLIVLLHKYLCLYQPA